MKTVLLLVHRIPFPPDKGDKIRSFHVLRELQKHFKVVLGTFVDDAHDMQYQQQVADMCSELHCVRLSKLGCMLRAAIGLILGHSVTTSWYRSRGMKNWVEQIASSEKLVATVAFSSGMAQFFPERGACDIRIMDFVDLDSEKWHQLARSHARPMKWIYAREAALVAREESEVANLVDHSTFVSEEEAALLRTRVRNPSSVMAIRNGIDCDYFDPSVDFPDPFESGELPLVFTGAMDYWANAEAVIWFAENVLALLREQHPTATFYIVGAKPTSGVRKLAAIDGVVVTGRVPDVRPYLRRAGVVVAPLKLARGVQNKVLEAMAMARPIVATAAAIEGIGEPEDEGLRVADSASDFAAACLNFLRLAQADQYRPALREYVLANFSWQENLKPLLRMIGDASVKTP